MTDKKSLILAGEKEQLIDVGHQVKALLPGGAKLTDNQATSLGNYALLNKANPFRGEVYGYVDFRGNLQLVDGYKLLVRWAKKISEYDESYSERLPAGTEGLEEGDIGYRITVIRHDKKASMREYIEMGATFQEAKELVSVSAIGLVLKKETWSKNKNKPIDPPTGWTWDQVARKRALKNALNQAYAMPSLDEIAKESWQVDNTETVSSDWEVSKPYQTEAETERHAELAAQNRQRQEKVASMSDREREQYDASIVEATDTMRNNGDDDPLGDRPPIKMSPGMEASTKFWKYANAQGINREVAGKYIQQADGDFDQALKALKSSEEVK